MPVLIYSPTVECIITTQSGTYDVSSDITSGTINIQENTTHTMSLNLLNAGRKYDRVFAPDDKFEIYMTRLKRLLIMTGYLDSVPYYSVWPKTIPLAGSSTTKRLLYHFWDPGSSAATLLMQGTGNTGDTGSDTSALMSSADGGMRDKAIALLTKVAGWPADQIHIGALPTQWLAKICSLYNAIEPQLAASAQALGVAASVAGVSSSNVSDITNPSPAAPTGSQLPTNISSPVPYKGTDLTSTGINAAAISPYYAQMQWGYQTSTGTAIPGTSKTAINSFLGGQLLVVANPSNNHIVVVQITGWGPSGSSGGIGLSPEALKVLAPGPNDQVTIGWVKQADLVSTRPGVPGPNSDAANLTSSTGTAATGDGSGGEANVTNPQAVNTTTTATGAGATAIAYCQANMTQPYIYGSGRPIDGTVHSSYDCSSYVGNAWFAAYGGSIGDDTGAQYGNSNLSSLTTTQSTWQAGDLLYYGSGGTTDHVAMYDGNGSVYEAADPQQGIHHIPVYSDAGDGHVLMGIKRVAKSASGKTLSTGGTTSISAAGASGATGMGPITIWDWFGETADPLSQALTGVRALLNDTPLLPMIQTCMGASMRSFCSAPNGDFIAWFPDYFGLYGAAAVMKIADIELQDFNVTWSDLNLVTHQFTAGASSNGDVTNPEPGGPISFQNVVNTQGVATIDFPLIMETLFGIGPNSTSGFTNTTALLKRFGARPLYTPMGTILGHLAEFWLALYLFQQNWSAQFSASVPITFMPELYPGMLLQIPSLGFQAYIEQVTHNFDMSNGGGFTTSVNIIAPSAMDGSGLWGLPKAGDSLI
jgi:cell wall-associated NlpC family hydrolase